MLKKKSTRIGVGNLQIVNPDLLGVSYDNSIKRETFIIFFA